MIKLLTSWRSALSLSSESRSWAAAGGGVRGAGITGASGGIGNVGRHGGAEGAEELAVRVDVARRAGGRAGEGVLGGASAVRIRLPILRVAMVTGGVGMDVGGGLRVRRRGACPGTRS